MTQSIPPHSTDGNFAHLLIQAAIRFPEGVALRDRGRSLDYASLATRAAAISSSLRARGVRPGDRVAVLLERGPDAVAAYFAALAAGAIVIMVNESLHSRQIEHIVTNCQVSLLISRPALLSAQCGLTPPSVPLFDVEATPDTDECTCVARPLDAPAQIIYTSGSMGLPKGVTLSHGNLAAGVSSITKYLGLHPEDRVMSVLPFSSVYGLNQMLCSIACGSTLVVDRSPLAAEMLSTLRDERATVLAAVPPLWLQILQRPDLLLKARPSLRILQNAGGHLPEVSVKQLRSALPEASLFLMYGLTEVLRSTYLPPAEVDRRPTSIGKAIPGAQVLVLDEHEKPCAPGQVGELVHSGPTVALGYWNDPEATARTFRSHPMGSPEGTGSERVVFSGDLVRQDEEGFLYYVGRRDRMIKSLGYRVGPDEIADVLYASGEVLEAVITTELDPRRGTGIVAHVVLRSGGSTEQLARFCRQQMPSYMRPRRFETHPFLPQLPSGKHDVEALCATSDRAAQAPAPVALAAAI